MYEELKGELYLVASKVTSKSRRELLEKAAHTIEKLQSEVVKWQENSCDWNNKYYHLLDNMPRWIPVTERLPKKWTWVLVCFDGADVPSTGFVNSAGDWIGEDMYTNYDVTHWMPLPEPLKEETDV